MGNALMLVTILAVAFLIKVPVLTAPLAGHFGSYQAINAMMADMIRFDSIRDVLTPRTFLIMEGKPALHLLYYPFASFFAAVSKFFLGGSTDFWGRFQASFFMLAAGFFLYGIAKRYLEKRTALLAALIFSFSPMTLISGISFQNEAVAVFFLLAAFWTGFFPSVLLTFCSGVLFSLVLVARLHFVFVAPAFLVLFLGQKGFLKRILLFSLGAVLPVSAWFGFTYSLERADGGLVVTSLFRQAGEGRILFHPLIRTFEFYKRVLEILTGQFFTPLLVPFWIAGVLSWDAKRIPFVVWTIGSLAGIFLLPQKVFDHPFYLISAVPAVAILAAPLLENFLSRLGKPAVWAFFAILFALMMRYYIPSAFSGFGADGRVREIGHYVQNATVTGDRVVASHGTSQDLLYYCGRMGWTFDLEMTRPRPGGPMRVRKLFDDRYGDPVAWIEKLRSEGGAYFVISEPAVFRKREVFFKYMNLNYQKLDVKSDSFEMFDLRRKIS